MNILIIEDDAVTLKALRYGVENLGHMVHAAESCEEGIGLTDSIKFDLIITDVMMPGISGLSLVSLLRSVKNFTAPIIMMSALNNGSLLEAGFKAGANDFILKPVMMEALKGKLERYDMVNQSQ